MKLLFVVDGRSPIALNWIRFFIEQGDEVHLVSTFPAEPEPGLASYREIRVALSGLKKGVKAGSPASQKSLLWSGGLVGLRTAVRQWLGPLTLPKAAHELSAIVKELRPQVVHAMRIPYEGMLAGLSKKTLLQEGETFPPLVLSVWGNDFTLHARKTPLMASYTRLALQQASALHTDCRRDQRVAYEWGFSKSLPAVVLPGNGGIRLERFYPPASRPPDPPVIVNPRGIRAYVRSDSFFKAIPLILESAPEACFVCPTMAGEPLAAGYVEQLGIQNAVRLLPSLLLEEMASVFRQAHVAVSPSVHDGTPNTLLEAMACGCFPVAGDIESLREWIIPGENGLLFNPYSPQSLAEAVLQAIRQPALRQKAQEINTRLIAERAEYQSVMRQAREFYNNL